MMFIGDQISKGETELKREIIKNNENCKFIKYMGHCNYYFVVHENH